ncbi:syndecan-2-like isoform X2 [Brienomyrus brachyistius]|uniref:syndecan-2-like isoform X2 n=2 Tax=Brienomyrus brachyistius TaxID=42636 RepID=UPI0020B2E4B1|nr:syndecan-2-like isoform X2 [Brienomyrus brachyistius]
MQGIFVLLLYLGLRSPVALSGSLLLEDMEGSGDDMEFSGLQEWMEDNSTEAVVGANASAEPPSEPQRPSTSALASAPPHLRHKSAEKDDLKKPVATRSTPEDQETLQDLEGSGDERFSGEGPVSISLTTRTSASTLSEDEFIPRVWIKDTHERTDDFSFEPPKMTETRDSSFDSLAKSHGLLERTEVLTGVTAGCLVTLALAITLISFMVHRLKKKDEDNYDMGKERRANDGYQKSARQEGCDT